MGIDKTGIKTSCGQYCNRDNAFGFQVYAVGVRSRFDVDVNLYAWFHDNKRRQGRDGAADGVIELFEELVDQGKTILMVTHDDELASRAQRIITLADGKIVGDVRRDNIAMAGTIQTHLDHVGYT